MKFFIKYNNRFNTNKQSYDRVYVRDEIAKFEEDEVDQFNVTAEKEIFNIKIIEKIGHSAVTEVKVEYAFAKYLLTRCSKYVSIWVDVSRREKIIVRGKIFKEYSVDQDGYVTIKIISNYGKVMRNLEEILEDYKQNPLYSGYMCTEDRFSQIIDNRPYDFYYDKSTGNVALSNRISTKYKTVIKPEDHFPEIMKIKFRKPPIRKINVSIDAEWVQENSGTVNLYPIICSHFNENVINSYTNITRQWRRIERSLPKSCYSVLNSEIREIPCPQGRDSCSRFFPISDKRKIIFKRFWFKGNLDLAWQYRQKQNETVEFSVINFVENQVKIDGNDIKKCSTKFVQEKYYQIPERNLHMKISIKKMQNNSVKSFFKTKEGQGVILNLASRAYSILAASESDIEVTLFGSFPKFADITVDDAVKIFDKRFENGFFIGKVETIESEISSERQICKIKLWGRSSEIQTADYDGFMKSVENRVNFDEDNLLHISLEDVVKSVDVRNLPDTQISALSETSYKTAKDITATLAKMPTIIKVNLNNLNQKSIVQSKFNIGTFSIRNSN